MNGFPRPVSSGACGRGPKSSNRLRSTWSMTDLVDHGKEVPCVFTRLMKVIGRLLTGIFPVKMWAPLNNDYGFYSVIAGSPEDD